MATITMRLHGSPPVTQGRVESISVVIDGITYEIEPRADGVVVRIDTMPTRAFVEPIASNVIAVKAVRR